MSKSIEFDAVIQDAGGGGAFVRVPVDVEKVFGSRRVKIRAAIDGEIYRGTLIRMGEPCHMLLIRKDIRVKIGKQPGDQVHVVIEEDTEPRIVQVPDDFRIVLDSEPEAAKVFAKLSYTHQKEYVNAILDAKRPETRHKRILKSVEMLKQKKTR